MSSRSVSGYLKAAGRFLHLAAQAREDDEDERERAEEHEDEEEAEEGEDREEASEKESTRRRGRKAKDDEECADEEDGDGPDDEEEDEEEAEEGEKERKAAARARASERARWDAVMSSAEAKDRVPLACALLADTSMSAARVRAVLANSPAQTPPARARGLAARMAEIPRPDVGSGGGASAAAAAVEPGSAAEMKALYDRAVGRR